MSVTYPLRLFFDCSTAHLSPATRRGLDDLAVMSHARSSAAIDAPSATPFGWFLWADKRPGPEVPNDLARVMRHARRLGAEYVLFDSDAPESSDLPLFAEEG